MKVARQLEAENPGIRFEVAYDNAHFVNVLFTNIWEELLTAILLTGIAVLLFLGEWRGTLIAMITLPTSLAMAVLLMMPFGMTFNSGTLIGLLLSIGRLVDDSSSTSMPWSVICGSGSPREARPSTASPKCAWPSSPRRS